ncbi:hypothetical protein Tco_1167933, partial [Tanacetum coccineum]
AEREASRSHMLLLIQTLHSLQSLDLQSSPLDQYVITRIASLTFHVSEALCFFFINFSANFSFRKLLALVHSIRSRVRVCPVLTIFLAIFGLKRKCDFSHISAQVLWLRTQLTYYGFQFDKIPMYCDSKAAIAISCNPVQHSRTKHIDVRYNFIKEKVEKGIVELFFVGTEYQLADLFTKALSKDMFKYLVRRLGMRCLTPDELEVLANEFA